MTKNKLGVVQLFFIGMTLVFGFSQVKAADQPYNEAADARAEIQQAQMANANKAVLLVFGANWCPDCRVLDTALKVGPSAKLIEQDFNVVKVNVGRFDRNLDIAKEYDVPLKKGIPAIVILGKGNEILFATRGGELADARKMGETGLHEFFSHALAANSRK